MRSRLFGRLIAATAAVLLALSLAACEDEPEPDFSDDVTASGTPIPPETSDATTEPTDEGPRLSPVQTVRAWVDGYNTLLRTGDASEAVALTTSTCKTCNWEVDPITEIHDRGGRFKGGAWKVLAAKVADGTRKGATVVVNAGIEVAAGSTVPRKGADPVVYESEKDLLQFKLRQDGGVWLITMIGVLQ